MHASPSHADSGGAPRFGLNGATTGDRADVLTDIRVAGAAGYQTVELRDAKIERYLAGGGSLPRLRDALLASAVDALSVNALEDSTLHSGAALQPILERTRTLARWAQALDCPFVVAVPSFLPAGGMGAGPIRMRTAASLRAMASAAAEFGVMLGFEFLGFPTCSVNTLAAARGVLSEVDDPRVGLVIDAFHFYAGGSRVEDLDGLSGEQVFIVHLDDAEAGEPSRLTDAQRLLPGEGVIPLRPLLDGLRGIGYRGGYSLELFRPEYWQWDAAQLARRGLDSMRRLFP
jgi:2-keto-myo-inositol isomerase